VLTQAHGVPVAVHLTPGRAANIFAASALLAAAQRPQEGLIDKGCHTDQLRAEACLQGSHPIIPASRIKQPETLDPARHPKRNRIERMAGLLKRFRRIAARHDQTDARGLSFVHVAAIQSWMRFARTAQSATPDSRPLAHAPPDHAPPRPGGGAQ
jgi:transposase